MKKYKFGIISDTHLGSLFERLDLIKIAYDTFKKKGISCVFHCGDILDGSDKMHRGIGYEQKFIGADQQINHCVNEYPRMKKVITYFISGNHDLSFKKEVDIDVGKVISERRKDLIYLGPEEVDISINDKEGNIFIRLVHPGKGSAYALSYHPQKYIESLTGGEKPHIILMGHYHKAEYLFYRNIHLIQAGTLQSQTAWLRRQNISISLGFWTIEFKIKKNSVIEFSSTFYPFFETKKRVKLFSKID